MKIGDRVAYAVTAAGAYTDEWIVPADRLVPVPEDVTDRLAAAALLKGLTAQVLLRRTYRVRKGTVVVVHAAVGGVGSILVQWARHLGATVIGVVGGEAKATIARGLGCHEVLVLGRDDIAARVKEITGGAGAHVVYDSVGKDTFFGSLDALRPLGLMVSYGNAFGTGAAARAAGTRPSRLAVPDPAGAVQLHHPARRPAALGTGTVRRDRSRQRPDRDRPDLCAARRATGAPRPAGAAHDRFDRAPALMRRDRPGSSLALLLLSQASAATQGDLVREWPAGIPSGPELEAAGAVIGTVDVHAGDIFDPSIPSESGWLYRTANKLHMNTRNSILADQLLFKPGERYVHRVVEETERILRGNDYLYDAVIVPTAWDGHTVDLEVRTRDTWTLNPGINFSRRGR